MPVVLTAWVVFAFARQHHPGCGFTAVLDFGDERFGLQTLPEVQALPLYRHEGVPGYDGQYYAQLALRPAVDDPDLVRVIDNPPYRARRIMMPWLSAALGLGRPWWVLHVQAFLNLATWFGLGALLLRWYRPGDWEGALRWSLVMLSGGLLSSLRHALTDGPALFALAGVVALIEARRHGPAVVGAAVAGLTRETALLVAAAWAPADWRSWRGWVRAAGLAALAAVPLAAWMLHLRGLWNNGLYDGSGVDNFNWPFAGFLERWRLLVGEVGAGGLGAHVIAALLGHLALTVQAAWIVARPRWSNPWWRIGAVHVALLAVLNTQVWEGYPGAAARVLLPLMLAFNLLVPRGRAALLLIVLGNLGVAAGWMEMQPLVRPTWTIEGPAALVAGSGTGERMRVRFGEGFFQPESYRQHAWRWSNGDARLRITNPHAGAVRVDLSFGLQCVVPQQVELRVGGAVHWIGTVGRDLQPVALAAVEVPPGGAEIGLHAEEQAEPLPGDARRLSVAIYNLRVVVREEAGQPSGR